MSTYKLTNIYVYPVKSLRGISLKQSKVLERGFQYDRRWMLVDNENMFITQRLFPQMIFISIDLDEEHLTFSHMKKKMESLKISKSNFPEKEINVTVWDDTCLALEYEKSVNEWFSEAVDFNCKLVYMPTKTERKTSIKYFSERKNVSFADGYPYLIIGKESLKNLNEKLNKPVLMEQFRPNLVFSGGKFHDEDNWKNIRIGKTPFAVVKPCARCVITTIDLEKGTKNKEPLTTLSSYRNFNNKIMFGQNAIALKDGILNVGDEISIQNYD